MTKYVQARTNSVICFFLLSATAFIYQINFSTCAYTKCVQTYFGLLSETFVLVFRKIVLDSGLYIDLLIDVTCREEGRGTESKI